MNRRLRMLLLAGISLLTGCATRESLLRQATLPVQARTDPSHYVVVTVRNDLQPPMVNPGSTSRGYDAFTTYGVSPRARAAVHELEQNYHLHAVAAWPIAALKVHCIVFRLPAFPARSRLLLRLEHDRRVESAEPLNLFRTAARQTADTLVRRRSEAGRSYLSLQRNLRELGVLKAQRLSRGAGVRIAVIDTGIDYRHPQLQGRVVLRQNFVHGSGGFTHDRHGTEVAGVIAAIHRNGRGILGVAPEAHLLALKACWPLYPGAVEAECDTFTLALALDAAITDRANVVNLSLAGPADPLLARLIRYGMRRGIIYVGAVAPSRLGLHRAFPTGIPGVLAVQSGEGPDTSHHLAAPGHGILTLAPGGSYEFASGSSMATAEVTGAVALLLAKKRHLTAASLDAVLARSSRRIAIRGGTLTSIDAYDALAQALGSACGSAQDGPLAEATPAAATP